MTFKDILSK